MSSIAVETSGTDDETDVHTNAPEDDVLGARAPMLIPSDLAGLTTATYDWPRSDGNHQAAVGPACDNIRKMILTLGFSERTSTQVRAVQEEQVRQGADLPTILRFLLHNFVSDYELTHVKKLASGEPFPFKKSDTFEKELRRLLSLGLIA